MKKTIGQRMLLLVGVGVIATALTATVISAQAAPKTTTAASASKLSNSAKVGSTAAKKAVTRVISQRHSAPKLITVAEYMKAPGAVKLSKKSAAAAKCWSTQFKNDLSVQIDYPKQTVVLQYGWTGKWCVADNGKGKVWRMAVMNPYIQIVGPGSIVFSQKKYRTVGATVWPADGPGKYAIGVKSFSVKASVNVTVAKSKVGVNVAFDRCIRGWGDRAGRRTRAPPATFSDPHLDSGARRPAVLRYLFSSRPGALPRRYRVIRSGLAATQSASLSSRAASKRPALSTGSSRS